MATCTIGILLLAPVVAFADVPVHVVATGTLATDACAICHRAHTANVPLGYRTPDGDVTTGNALALSPAPSRGDVGLCYMCHGIAALGASVDVETSLTLNSVHRVAPSPSPTFGPDPKMCGSCHDPHGSDKTPTGEAFPALLRVWTSSSTTVTAGEEYCDTCHQNRAAAGSRYDALATYRQTGHYRAFPDPASGTRIRCLGCHVGHGSPIAPLVAGYVKPPAALGALPTATVTANDRTLCMSCHEADLGTWENEVAYAGSLHALSTTQVVIPGEWPVLNSKRKLGECQVCHAPMGRTGAGGIVIPDLAEKPGRQLCDTCHQAAGPASTDLLSIAYDGTESGQLELAAVYGPATQTAGARAALYGRDPASAGDNALLGPREYRAPDATATAASGDIDGDGDDELVVAKPSSGDLTVYDRDALLGIATASLWGVAVPITPDFIAIGSFVSGSPDDQIAVLDRTAATPRLRVYRYNAGSLVQLGATVLFSDAGAAPSGLASGDVTGTALADLVVTDSGTGQLYILAQDGAGSSDLAASAFPTKAGPRGPSVGDAWPGGGNEIIVCNPGETTATLSVFDGAGARLGDFTAADRSGDGVPYASTVANVWWADATDEVCVAMYSETGTSCVSVFRQDGSALATTSLAYGPEGMYGTGTLAAGDLNGDGNAELAVGNGGLWSATAGMVAPSLQVYRWIGGNSLAVSVDTYVSGGAELAGGAPALVITDFGPVLPSRHPIDEVAATHVSTETAPFVRHVTCADCHNPHEANAGAASAPAIGGRMLGTWGVTAASPSGPATRSIYQYETCYKCHSASVAPQVDPGNASVHAIEASATASTARAVTFAGSWTNDSILYCSDCHGNAASPPEPRGGHRSTAAPVLKSPILGVGPGDASVLCYDCHDFDLYRAGTGDTGAGSFFYKTGPPDVALHERHSGDFAGAGTGLELGCPTCHVSHGSTTVRHLLRSDIGYSHATPGGSCDNSCHGGASAKTY